MGFWRHSNDHSLTHSLTHSTTHSIDANFINLTDQEETQRRNVMLKQKVPHSSFGRTFKAKLISAKLAPRLAVSILHGTHYIHRIVFFPILTVNQSKRSIKCLSQLCTNQNFRALTRNLSFYRKAKRFACFSEFYVTLLSKSNKKVKKLWERAIRRRGCGINCECGGIVRNDIFPDTLAYQALTFLLWVTRRLNFFTGSLLGAWLCFDCDFCHR